MDTGEAVFTMTEHLFLTEVPLSALISAMTQTHSWGFRTAGFTDDKATHISKSFKTSREKKNSFKGFYIIQFVPFKLTFGSIYKNYLNNCINLAKKI